MTLTATEIPGWMSHEELDWLAEQARTAHKIVEIGSWQGRSTKALASATEGTVWAVDDLTGEAKSPLAPAELERRFTENLHVELLCGKVAPIRQSSLAAAEIFLLGSVDMVFIDGDHEAPAPADDLAAWLPKLKAGGLMCGHDRFHEGVAAALKHLLWRPGPGSIWRLV